MIVTGDHDLTISADMEKIERVLINLIQNALKYAPGSAVTLRTEKITGFVKIYVIDQGPGIAPEKMKRIFWRYFCSDPGGVQTGLGLGLYISAEIVQQHGGEIGVESLPGQGCTFWFTLPAGI